jgi:hypothetical protein
MVLVVGVEGGLDDDALRFTVSGLLEIVFALGAHVLFELLELGDEVVLGDLPLSAVDLLGEGLGLIDELLQPLNLLLVLGLGLAPPGPGLLLGQVHLLPGLHLLPLRPHPAQPPLQPGQLLPGPVDLLVQLVALDEQPLILDLDAAHQLLDLLDRPRPQLAEYLFYVELAGRLDRRAGLLGLLVRALRGVQLAPGAGVEHGRLFRGRLRGRRCRRRLLVGLPAAFVLEAQLEGRGLWHLLLVLDSKPVCDQLLVLILVIVNLLLQVLKYGRENDPFGPALIDNLLHLVDHGIDLIVLVDNLLNIILNLPLLLEQLLQTHRGDVVLLGLGQPASPLGVLEQQL